MGNDALDRLKKIRGRSEAPQVPARAPQSEEAAVIPEPDSPEDIETKRMPLKIEKELWQEIARTCSDLGVSKDVFIEALYLHYQRNAEQQEAIAQEARERRERRVEVGNRKRLKSLQEKYG